MRCMGPFLLFFYLIAGPAWAQSSDDGSVQRRLQGHTDDAPGGAQTAPALQQQPWQERRAGFWKTVHGVNAHDAAAAKDFDAVLTQFETQPFARTPMENMDILGVFYAQKDEVEKTLMIVSANAALGWYDALRFGSESGRAEIMNNEKFFARAFLLSGVTTTDKFKEFLKASPDLASKSVSQGLAFAERERKSPHYDVSWPTAYGLERVVCAQGGSCIPPREMSADQWDNAWEDAKKNVISYYHVNASAAGGVTGDPVK
jgi:hypothetical protein